MGIGKSSMWSVAGVAVALVLTACSSSGPSRPSVTTTTKPAATTTTTIAGGAAAAAQAAETEAARVVGALHDRQPEFCATPNFERNITIPAEQHVPVPVVRATCNYSTVGEVVAVAFANPADDATYMKNWTGRLCDLSNKSGRRGLNATFWVVNDRSVTLVPTLDGAQTVAPIVGGQIHQETCPA